jgi:predicted aspartyl protease
LIRIERPDGDSILATVDTGFNGDLFMSAADALQFGWRGSGIRSAVKLADAEREIEEAEASILWMGKPRDVELLLSHAEPRPSAADEPIALIGTRLMTPHLLLIDFQAATVEIEEQA